MYICLPLPITSAIASIRWPLSEPALPMYYEPLTSLRTLRQPNAIPPTLKPIIDIPSTINDLITLNNNDESRDNIITALALIFLGNGMGDEAHDLITPLSWSEDTYFGGPTLCSEAEDAVVSMASYVHSLVHRKEGFAQGEFGMIGYQNANYWANAARARDDIAFIPYKEIRDSVLEASTEFGPEAENWCRQRIVEEGGHDDCYWETRALHELCARVSTDDSISNELKEFAERAAEVELRVLLRCSLKRAGYECGDCLRMDNDELNTSRYPSTKAPQLDDNLALAVANKVSSAHLGAFQSSNCVTLRNVVRSLESGDADIPLSVAAGLACRLLASPACKFAAQDDSDDILYIILPVNESEGTQLVDGLVQKFGSSFYGGGPLSVGDAFAFVADTNVEPLRQNGLYTFIPCESSDDGAVFIDRFHGTRGDTPTCVLQWSKGTIHKSNHN